MFDGEIGIGVILCPLGGALLAPLAYAVRKKAVAWFAVFFALMTCALSLLLLTNIQSGVLLTYDWIPSIGFSIALNLDALGVYVAVVAGSIGFLVVLYSVRYMEHAEIEGYSLLRYYSLTLLFVGSMIGLALSDSIILVYIFWELVGFCSYALISYYYKDPKALRAGTKAFVVTRIGDIGLFIAIVALWGSTHSTSLAGIVNLAPPDNMLLTIAGFGVLLAAIGKSAQFPLHVWLPDAMEAPTTISALIHAATMVNAGVYLVARTYPIFSVIPSWPMVAVIIGMFTALFAATMALAEPDLKRVLALSTISQLGFMLSAAGAGAILAFEFHLVSHAIFKGLLFLCAGAVIHSVHTRNMYEMGGLAKHMKITNVTFIIGILALIGIPILNGFWSKDLVLDSLTGAGYVGAVGVLIIASFLTAVYSWRMYYLVFLGKKRTPLQARDPPYEMRAPLVILGIATLVSWIFIGQFSGGLAYSLPSSYGVALLTARSMIEIVLLKPLVIISIVSLCIVTWLAFGYKDRMMQFLKEDRGLAKALKHGYWFDDLYRVAARGLFFVGRKVSYTQTGDVNYNLAGIVLGGIVVLMILLLGNTGW
jgi:NADH-quinone oxidoreductase subunit L